MTYVVDGKAMSFDELVIYQAEKELSSWSVVAFMRGENALRRERGFDQEIKKMLQVGYPASILEQPSFYVEWAKQENGLSHRAELMQEEAALAVERVTEIENIAAKISERAARHQGKVAEALQIVVKDWERAARLEGKTAKILAKAAQLQRETENTLQSAIQTQAELAQAFRRVQNRQGQAVEVLKQRGGD